jgi:hypothetical protein
MKVTPLEMQRAGLQQSEISAGAVAASRQMTQKKTAGAFGAGR